MKATEFAKRVAEKAGFSLLSPTQAGFAGVQVSTGKTLVLDLNGEILREATKDDINQWNTIWNEMATEAYK